MKPPSNPSSAGATVGSDVVVATMEGVGMLFDSYQSRVLADVGLVLRRGEVVGLLGPEGAGKTTLLKILAGRLRPSEGKVCVFGHAPGRAASRIGYLAPADAKSSSLGRWLGVFGKTPESPNGKDAAAQAPGLARLQQAVLGNRDLIVLDEPFAGLEAAARKEAVELLRTLASRGKTVMFSAASLVDAAGVCDRVAMLYAGRIQGIGTLAELLATTDGIRVTAPVLPPNAAERVLVALRRELLADGLLTGASRDQAGHGRESGQQQAQPASTSTAADDVLAPLLTSPGDAALPNDGDAQLRTAQPAPKTRT